MNTFSSFFRRKDDPPAPPGTAIPVEPTVVTGGVLGGGPPKPFNLVAKSPAQHQTAADILDYACQKYKATYSIHRPGKGLVIVDIKLADGHTVHSGNGGTTEEAVRDAVRKLGPQ